MTFFSYMYKSKLSTYIFFCSYDFFPLLTRVSNLLFLSFSVLLLHSGDRRPAQRAGRQRLQTGLPRLGQGEGKGRDDHLLPHQRPRRQLTTGQALPSLTLVGQRWSSRSAKGQRSRRGKRRQYAACLQHAHKRRSALKRVWRLLFFSPPFFPPPAPSPPPTSCSRHHQAQLP